MPLTFEVMLGYTFACVLGFEKGSQKTQPSNSLSLLFQRPAKGLKMQRNPNLDRPAMSS